VNEHTESIRRLEEKIAYLERHVTEQDKAMLEFADDLARLRREMKSLLERAETRAGEGGADGGELPDERPPHY
jgi:SlyX protein